MAEFFQNLFESAGALISECAFRHETTAASERHTAVSVPVVRVRPSRGWTAIRLRELWDSRELLYFFVWSQIKIRYKQTLLGASWALLQPILNMVFFSLFFGKLAKVPSDGMPYPLFAFAALVPWTFFANALAQASNSLVGNAGLITKVYFPRMILPASCVLSGLLDFALSFVLLLGLMASYGCALTWNAFWSAAFLLLAICVAVGVSFWLSALNVQYRDVRYVVPFLVQIWLLATPIAYPSSLVPERWRALYGLNPMAGVTEGFRWALLGSKTPDLGLISASISVALLLLITGAIYFRQMERTFADVI
jgi:lipopolysaccharide transport system permease protein